LLPGVETVDLTAADTRVLAQDVYADRDYPTLNRTARDGFAVRSADMPGRVQVIGEVRAGARFDRAVAPGEAVEIMTGAPIPAGADTVVMVEHVRREGDWIEYQSAAAAGQFINVRGSEATRNALLLRAGTRIGYAEVAMLAAVGCARVSVYCKPSVAIIATGDELVEPGEPAEAHQIRNSNAYSVAAQVARAGGIPAILPVARDHLDATRALIEQGLAYDLLLLSGGVSAGKYDVVELALAALGAVVVFDRVAIQPGQPLVFGRVRERFFFGLPGNPASTMVTFELFAKAALEMLGGEPARDILFTQARLTQPYKHRGGLSRFLPALVAGDGELTPIQWTGSSDIAALTRANAFMVVDADRMEWATGDLVPVLFK
jgi:molybdopterin molybdotransferase